MSELELPAEREAAASGIWSERVQIHSYEVDCHHQVTLEALCRYFQEAAWNHAEALGVGFRHLATQNRVWVLSRLLVKVERFARWGETLTLQTWPRAAKSVFAMRDFELADAAGTRLMAGTSAWLVLDAHSRRPQRVDKVVAGFKRLPDKRALAEDPEKLPPCPAGNAPAILPVRYSDIDVNHHVNSMRYIGWLMDSYPLEFHRTHAVSSLEMNYLGETLAAETVSLHSQETAPGEFCHSIAKANGAEESCRARIRWKRGGNSLSPATTPV